MVAALKGCSAQSLSESKFQSSKLREPLPRGTSERADDGGGLVMGVDGLIGATDFGCGEPW